MSLASRAPISLDSNPTDVKAMFDKHGLTITSVCAHANLLDATSPAVYSTVEVLKAVRLAAGMGVTDVITTEGDPKTDWGHNLSDAERVFIVAEKLAEPVRLAEAMGIRILLEPHGILTDSIDGIQAILDKLGNPSNLGVNMDTGNSWLGGDGSGGDGQGLQGDHLARALEGSARRLGGTARHNVRLWLRPHCVGRGRHRRGWRL
jgi:inosose dehydratase